MYFTPAFLAAVLPLLATAAPPNHPPVDKPSFPFTLTAIASGTPVQNEPIRAIGSNFYVGKGANFAMIYQDGGFSLDVNVPGGQIVYIPPTGPQAGAFSYTQAHNREGDQVITTGFSYNSTANDSGNGRIAYGPSLLNATSFLACPLEEKDVYQIFVNIFGVKPPKNANPCIGIDVLTTSTTPSFNEPVSIS